MGFVLEIHSRYCLVLQLTTPAATIYGMVQVYLWQRLL